MFEINMDAKWEMKAMIEYVTRDLVFAKDS